MIASLISGLVADAVFARAAGGHRSYLGEIDRYFDRCGLGRLPAEPDRRSHRRGHSRPSQPEAHAGAARATRRPRSAS
jgi:hypothetical protein